MTKKSKAKSTKTTIGEDITKEAQKANSEAPDLGDIKYEQVPVTSESAPKIKETPVAPVAPTAPELTPGYSWVLYTAKSECRIIPVSTIATRQANTFHVPMELESTFIHLFIIRQGTDLPQLAAHQNAGRLPARRAQSYDPRQPQDRIDEDIMVSYFRNLNIQQEYLFIPNFVTQIPDDWINDIEELRLTGLITRVSDIKQYNIATINQLKIFMTAYDNCQYEGKTLC